MFAIRMAILSFAILSFVSQAGKAHATTEVSLERVKDPELRQALTQAFVLPMVLELPDVTPGKRTSLIEAQAQKLERLLRFRGYLRSAVTMFGDPGTDAPVLLRPEPGQLYRVGWIKVTGLPGALPEEALLAFDAVVAPFAGRVATGEVLKQIEAGLIWQLRDASYADGQVVRVDVTTEPVTRTAGVTFTLVPGKPVQVGEVQIEGTRHSDLVKPIALSTLREGAPYSETKVDELRQVLEKTGLFNKVDVSLSNDLTSARRAEVEVALVDRLPEPHFFQRNASIGPALAIIAMVLIVLRECTGAGARWFGKPVGSVLSGALLIFYSINILVIAIVIFSIISM
ncbi:MAG: hypothetical protein K5905_11980 [Roseibium sp.]|uniref:POTRA domain-containing protein n=1 Tax=Roseibium sp. TaxID=1936156 RepID=UPI0026203DFD|nr:hypothetical protein [Roseibium sp.]MCV0426185.1 hypothetical protein [Roseibium sp.]